MAKTPDKFSTSVIEKVFTEKKIKLRFEDFITALVEAEKKEKALKAAIDKEERAKIHVSWVYPKLKDGVTLEDFIDEIVGEQEWYDHFSSDEEGGMSDDGEDDTLYFKVGDKIYEVEIHCESDWVGDWSVRANLPGEVSVTSIKEIKKYEIIKQTKDSLTIKKTK